MGGTGERALVPDGPTRRDSLGGTGGASTVLGLGSVGSPLHEPEGGDDGCDRGGQTG